MSVPPLHVETLTQAVCSAEVSDLVRAMVRKVIVRSPSLGVVAYAKRRGAFREIAYYCGEDWCFSFPPWRDYVTWYVRPPEMKRGRLGERMLVRAFGHGEMRDAATFKARLRDEAELGRALDLIATTR